MKPILITILLLHSISSNNYDIYITPGVPSHDPLERITDCKAYDYIQSVYPIIQQVSQQYNIPEPIIMAQAIQESGFGTSNLAINHCNHLGIRGNHKYRHYDNETNCFNHYGRVLNQKCYRNLQPKTVDEWLQALVCCGYAADSIYVVHLKQIIQQYNL